MPLPNGSRSSTRIVPSDMTHASPVIVGGGLGADDYVDYQLGYTGRIQYGLFYQSADSRGNRGIEGDNSEYNQAAEPYSNPTMYNLTFIGSGQPGFDEANSPGIFLRRGRRARRAPRPSRGRATRCRRSPSCPCACPMR